MKKFKLFIGYILNAILGLIYYPLIEFAVSGILGTLNGSAYTIQEPELSAYKQFGVFILIILIISLIISQLIIRFFLFKQQKKQYYFSIAIFAIFIVISVFLVK